MIKSHKVLGVVCSAALVSMISVIFADFLPTYGGAYADQRFLLAGLVGCLAVVSTFYLAAKGLSSKKSATFLLPAALFVLGFPALSFAFREQDYAFIEPGLYSFYFAAAVSGGLALATLRAVGRYLEFFVSVAAGACFLYGAMSLNVYLFALVDGQADLSGLIPWGFVNIRYWSHVATWLLPILPLAVLIGPLRRYRLWRAIVATGAGLWWWIILLSASRGSIIGVASGVLLVTLFFGRQSVPWLRQFIVYLMVGVAIWLLLSVLVPSLLFGEAELRSVHATSSGRLPLFIEAWQMSMQRFPFGMGPQSWLTHDLLTDDYLESNKFGHPHNMYLMWAAEYGWLLVLLFVMLVLQLAFHFWRQRAISLVKGRKKDAIILCGITSSAIGALMHAGVSAVFIAPGSMLVGLFILIAFWGLVAPRVFAHSDGIGIYVRAPARLVLSAFLATAIFILWLLWVVQVHAYYLDMRADEIYYEQQHNKQIMPRFWFHGNFPRPLSE